MKRASVFIGIGLLLGIMILHTECGIATAAPAPAKGKAASGENLQAGIRDFDDGSYEEAEQELLKARADAPSSALAAYYLGRTYKKMQNYPEALKHLKDSVTLQPAVPAGFLELADTYYALDQYDQALAALEVAAIQSVEPAQTAFLKGLILQKKKKYEDAIRAFSAAKTADSKLSSSADYQIGMAYAGMGKRDQALETFKALAAREPGSDLGLLAGEQAKVLEAATASEKKRFKAFAGLQFQYDSNVVLKPNGVAVDVSGKGDTSTVVNAQAEYKALNAEASDLKLQYALYWNAHQKLKDFDVQSHVLGAENNYRLSNGKTFSVLANYNYTIVDSAKYETIITFAPVFSFVPADNQRLLLSLLYQIKDYAGPPVIPDENRNAKNTGAGIAWITPIQQGSVVVRYDINHEDAEGNNWSYLGNKVNFGLQRALTEKTRVSGNIDINLQSFDNIHSTFNEKRSDKTYTAALQALYTIVQNVDAQLSFSYIQNDSTLPVYTFNKYIAGLGVQAAF